MTSKTFETASSFSFDLKLIPTQVPPRNVLMVTPDHFNIERAINAHMLDNAGNPRTLDKAKAQEQWQNLKLIYEKLELQLYTLPGEANLPDMVFCANQSFPFLDNAGQKNVVISNMKDDVRQKEVEAIKQFYLTQGYKIHHLPSRSQSTLLEGMGDLLWLGSKRLLLGGHGFRTHKSMYEIISETTQCPVAIFELKNDKFYHLDTCLSILNDQTALYCPEAFTTEGRHLLETIFSRLLPVPLEEADSPGFACNAHCPDGLNVIIQKGNLKTVDMLKTHGFIPVEVDTTEYIKSGGSVFCMKMMFF